jgi:hypothetical protein
MKSYALQLNSGWMRMQIGGPCRAELLQITFSADISGVVLHVVVGVGENS